MVLYTVTRIPSIYPSHVSIYTIHGSCGIYVFNIVICTLIFSRLQINVFAGVTRVIFMSMWLMVSLLIIASLIVVSLVFGKYLQSIQMFATSYFFKGHVMPPSWRRRCLLRQVGSCGRWHHRHTRWGVEVFGHLGRFDGNVMEFIR